MITGCVGHPDEQCVQFKRLSAFYIFVKFVFFFFLLHIPNYLIHRLVSCTTLIANLHIYLLHLCSELLRHNHIFIRFLCRFLCSYVCCSSIGARTKMMTTKKRNCNNKMKITECNVYLHACPFHFKPHSFILFNPSTNTQLNQKEWQVLSRIGLDMKQQQQQKMK